MRNRIRNQDPTKIVEKISSSKFEFKYMIDTRDLPDAFDRKGQSNSEFEKVQMCFGMSARNSDNGISGEVRIQTDGRYAVRAPEILWADNQSTVLLPSKQMTELRFEVSDPRGLGEVSVPQSQIPTISKSMRSQVEIVCEDPSIVVAGSSSSFVSPASSTGKRKTCVLKIQPECPPASQRQRPLESSVKLVLKVSNKLGERIRQSEIFRDFKILAEESNCPVSSNSAAPQPGKPEKSPEVLPKPR